MMYVKTPRRAWSALSMLLALLAAWPLPTRAAADGEPQRLQAITINAGMHNIHAELALTPEQRQKGLMFRRDLAAHEGMLFVFDEPMPQCFWMRNTPTPLAIAFVADDGRIVNIDEMKPLSDESHCSTAPVRYVLEMNTGWFAKRGIKAGFKLAGPPFKSRP